MRLVAFRKLWMSSAFEGVGDEGSRVVIPIIAVSMLGAGALEVGIINALSLSAFLVLGVPIGVWVDRFGRRRLMIAADVFRALVVLSVPTAFMAGAMSIGHLLVCVALISVADVVFTTAHGAFVPSVVDREQVSDAYARLQSAASLVAVGSPSLTAALLSVIAAPFALVTAGISYAWSALTLASIQVGEDIKPPRRHEGFWPAARAGLSFTIHHPVLRGFFLSSTVLNAATMFGSAATAVYALGFLGLSPAVFALLATFAALGSLAGAGIVPRIAPAHRLGTVMASSRLFVLGVMPLASLAGGGLAAWIGVQPVLWIWALLAGASVVPIVFSPMRNWREFPADSYDAERPATG